VVAAVVSFALAMWAAITTNYPPVVMAAGALVVWWIAIDIQDRYLEPLIDWLGPPLYVDINGMSVNFVEPSQQTQEFARRLGRHYPVLPAAEITFPIYLLNRSKNRRVSLRVMAFHIERPEPEMGFSISGGSERNPWIDLGELVLNLGPDEDSRGMATIAVSEGQPWVSGNHVKMLVVKDQVSGRYARLTIPGKYPEPASQRGSRQSASRKAGRRKPSA
jgi:hypothetical protein